MRTDFGRLLLDESPDAVIASTPGGRVLDWSRGAESLLGFTGAEALGQTVHELIVRADRADEERGILREAVESGVSTYESVRKRKDGSTVYVGISSEAVRDAREGMQ